MKILSLNSGSSSVKFQLIDSRGWRVLQKGKVELVGPHGKLVTLEEAMKNIIQNIPHTIGGVGHRVVHGGTYYRTPVKITKTVLANLKKLSDLAPLHNPINTEGIRIFRKLLPKIPNIAVFDTAFFQTLPEKAYVYAVPYEWYKKYRIRRYGFHGTSHKAVFLEAKRRYGLASLKRTITCHLGNGCSITAILNGKPIDTSMGFTPLEGIPMGTRSGDIDPSIIEFLVKKDFSMKKIFDTLNHESGLKGLSGISNDMRLIYAASKRKNRRAQLAIDIFIYRIVKYIAAYIAILSGLDCLIFTGGIGENAPYIRKNIVSALKPFLEKTKVLVIKTNEELMIAKETYALLK